MLYHIDFWLTHLRRSKMWRKHTPQKCNIDTKNDGVLNVSPTSNMASIWVYSIHLSFRCVKTPHLAVFRRHPPTLIVTPVTRSAPGRVFLLNINTPLFGKSFTTDEGSPPLEATSFCWVYLSQWNAISTYVIARKVSPIRYELGCSFSLIPVTMRNLHVSMIASWQGSGFASQIVIFSHERYFIRRLNFITQSIITRHIMLFNIHEMCIHILYVCTIYQCIHRCIHMNIEWTSSADHALVAMAEVSEAKFFYLSPAPMLLGDVPCIPWGSPRESFVFRGYKWL